MTDNICFSKINIPGNFNIEERIRTAQSYFKDSGYNCCQSVVLAYKDIIGLDTETATAITSGFGGGMGRLREVCGTVSGMFMIAGFISPATDPSKKSARTENYALVQDFAEEFRHINGSIVCRELLGLAPKQKQETPVPSDRTEDYYKKRPCAELVGIAARIVGEKLLKISQTQNL